MKFSLKTLAAAVVMAAAASGASAAIDNGAGGNGELFFNAWDGASSYSFDLNLSIDAFEADNSAAGLYSGVWGSAEGFSTSFSSWLSTANTSSLEWNILATDTVAQKRILTTVGAATLPAKNKNADILRTGASQIQGFVNAVNPTLVGNSGVTTTTAAPSYAGNIGATVFTKFNFDTTGDLSANSYTNGLTFQKTLANASGITQGTNNAYFDDTVAVRAWVGSDNTLHMAAAVPEPESYAMLLAGLGMLGFMARRRLNNRV